MGNCIFKKLMLVSFAYSITAILIGCSNDSSPTKSLNNPPIIKSIVANPSIVTTSQSTNLTCIATDMDSDSLSYVWKSNSGSFTNNIGANVRWYAPNSPGIYSCVVIVSDGIDIAQDSIVFNVKFPNRSPLEPYNPNPSDGATNVSISPTLTWECVDPDGDSISYDIRFGKINYVQLVKINHKDTRFNPGVLEVGNFYSWQIIAKDDYGHVTSSNSWHFSTVSK
jgi:hypothetical protein